MRILPILAAATISLFATAALAQNTTPAGAPGGSGEATAPAASGTTDSTMGTKKMTKKQMKAMQKKKGMSSSGM